MTSKPSTKEAEVLPEAAPTGNTQIVTQAPLPVASEYGQEFRVSDLIPTPSRWAEYPQTEIDALVGEDMVLSDAMYFDSIEYPGDRWAILLLLHPATGEYITTATGGSIILEKIEKLRNWEFPNGRVGALPCVVRITKTPSKNKAHSDYYDII